MSESFVMYKSFHDALKELPAEQYGRVMFAINEYALFGAEPDFAGVEKALFTLIRPQLDANARRRGAGDRGGRPQVDVETRRVIEDGLTDGRPQAELAEEYGVSQATVSNIKRGLDADGKGPADSGGDDYQKPNGDYQKPNGDYQKPNGDYQKPNGDYQKPMVFNIGHYQKPNVNVNDNDNDNVNDNANANANSRAGAREGVCASARPPDSPQNAGSAPPCKRAASARDPPDGAMRLFLRLWRETKDDRGMCIFQPAAAIERPRDWERFWREAAPTEGQVEAAFKNFADGINSGEIARRFIPATPDRFALNGGITRYQSPVKQSKKSGSAISRAGADESVEVDF